MGTLFLPEIYDLEIDVPLTQVLSADNRGKWWKALDVRFLDPDSGEQREVTLQLRDEEGFIETLQQAQAALAAPRVRRRQSA